jgi:hypothetical protein
MIVVCCAGYDGLRLVGHQNGCTVALSIGCSKGSWGCKQFSCGQLYTLHFACRHAAQRARALLARYIESNHALTLQHLLHECCLLYTQPKSEQRSSRLSTCGTMSSQLDCEDSASDLQRAVGQDDVALSDNCFDMCHHVYTSAVQKPIRLPLGLSPTQKQGIGFSSRCDPAEESTMLRMVCVQCRRQPVVAAAAAAREQLLSVSALCGYEHD